MNNCCTNCDHAKLTPYNDIYKGCFGASEFVEMRVCSTCKHRTTNIRDNPCLNCNRRPLKDHWEAIDG